MEGDGFNGGGTQAKLVSAQNNTVYQQESSAEKKLRDLDFGQVYTKASVFLVEDQTIVREGLRALLEADPRVEILGEACSGRIALEKLRALVPNKPPGVVLMDLAMPLLNGLATTRRVLKELPFWKVLVLSAYCGPEELEQCVFAGASGCIPKEASAQDLVHAIVRVSRGETAFGSEMLKHLLKAFRRDPVLNPTAGVQMHPSILTDRETEVLQLVAEGYANKQIAFELGISIKTVEKHRQHLMDKLNLHQTAGLTRYALEHGLVERFPHPKNLEI